MVLISVKMSEKQQQHFKKVKEHLLIYSIEYSFLTKILNINNKSIHGHKYLSNNKPIKAIVGNE